MMLQRKSRTIAARVAFCFAVLSADSVSAQQQDSIAHSQNRKPAEAKIMSNDELFQQVPLNTREQSACSPTDPGINWRGVVIRAPSRIILPERRAPHPALIVPVCGLYLVNIGSALRHPGTQMLIVIDETSGQVYRGGIVEQDPNPTIPPPPPPPLDLELYANQAYGSYFNINVASYVALPLRPARYRVRVEYAGHQSNEVRIAVIERQ